MTPSTLASIVPGDRVVIHDTRGHQTLTATVNRVTFCHIHALGHVFYRGDGLVVGREGGVRLVGVERPVTTTTEEKV